MFNFEFKDFLHVLYCFFIILFLRNKIRENFVDNC